MLIDSLNAGGAQRQFVLLAAALKDAGREVECGVYHDLPAFEAYLTAKGIPTVKFAATGKFGTLWSIRRWLNQTDTELTISFLDAPNLVNELAAIPTKHHPLIVSERNTTQQMSFR